MGQLTVWCSCVAVMEDGAIGARSADGRVGGMAAPPCSVAVVEENRLDLVLHHSRLALPQQLVDAVRWQKRCQLCGFWGGRGRGEGGAPQRGRHSRFRLHTSGPPPPADACAAASKRGSALSGRGGRGRWKRVWQREKIKDQRLNCDRESTPGERRGRGRSVGSSRERGEGGCTGKRGVRLHCLTTLHSVSTG